MSSVHSIQSDEEYPKEVCINNNAPAAINASKKHYRENPDDSQDSSDTDDQDQSELDYKSIINHESDIITSKARYSTDNYSLNSVVNGRRNKLQRKKSSVVTRGMDFIRRMKWKSNETKSASKRRLSQPDIESLDAVNWRASWSTQNTPRASIDGSSLPEGFIMPPSVSSTHVETKNLAPIHEAYTEQYSRALHTPSRFLPQNQAVITTTVDGTILLFNDIASLCFKIDKSYIGRSILTSLLEDPFRKQITSILDRRKHSLSTAKQQQFDHGSNNRGLVLVCGTITPIVKANQVKSVASLWLKEKSSDHGDHIYLWIFEEIYETSLSVYVDSECIIRRVLGTMIDIYGYKEEDITGKPVNCLVPALSKEQRDDNLEKMDRLKFFGSQSSQGISFPVILNLNRHVALGDDDLASFVVKITSLPSITGLMTVSRTTGLVTNLSPVPAKYLFGRSVSTIVDQFHVRELIPLLPFIIQKSTQPVMNNRMCRQVLLDENATEKPVIYVVHRDTSRFEVELQLTFTEEAIDIWITYDRIDAISKHEKRRKQEEERQQHAKSANGPAKQRPGIRPLRISSFGNVDQQRKLFPALSNNLNVNTTESRLVAHDELPPSPPEQHEKRRHPLDEYVILETLGQGTYGMAKLAFRKDDPSQKKLVIKYIIKSKIIVDSWIRDRQLGSIPMEIHILRTLQKYPHVNCCRLLTSSEDEDYYFVVMELLGDGMDLFDYIEVNKNMSENEMRAIFYQVACAVKHLHQHRIVHRDIKDENIILDQQGTVHLIDFGCATYYRKDRKFDTFTGTLEYCAPEILKGKPYAGPPQDIWASGILLYTLMYRENPFYNIDDIMETELRVPHVVSSDSLDLLQKMLQRDIDKRITVDEVLEHPWFHNMAL
ncbi:kinase-like domain-containing protein [Mucor lusitanicus]|uniref:Kinase-like domain-containing protein n=2 Tax=Mucor circinelloides f. lusitanicus TaxID=29924 RepID=A0A8H4BMZ2_MUCCL|nr:kinase-like domain-containing protein [Mucor lusitanicus]